MPIPALIAPLLAQGLGLISNAVLAKGKEWVEEKTGVKLDQPLSAEDMNPHNKKLLWQTLLAS